MFCLECGVQEHAENDSEAESHVISRRDIIARFTGRELREHLRAQQDKENQDLANKRLCVRPAESEEPDEILELPNKPDDSNRGDTYLPPGRPSTYAIGIDEEV
jgi:hypothetical protein